MRQVQYDPFAVERREEAYSRRAPVVDSSLACHEADAGVGHDQLIRDAAEAVEAGAAEPNDPIARLLEQMAALSSLVSEASAEPHKDWPPIFVTSQVYLKTRLVLCFLVSIVAIVLNDSFLRPPNGASVSAAGSLG